MSCQDFSSTSCKTIQVLEPDPTAEVLAFTIDPAIDERGENVLFGNQTSIMVTFATPKASANYRFEYLYVDALGLVQPGAVEPVVTSQTQYNFTIDFAGAPLATGYVLRWRVIVIDVTSTALVDAPENIYHNLLQGIDNALIPFTNPRSGITYGFSELRVENLIDPLDQQTPVLAQVVTKTVVHFIVALNPSPPTNHYYLVARTP